MAGGQWLAVLARLPPTARLAAAVGLPLPAMDRAAPGRAAWPSPRLRWHRGTRTDRRLGARRPEQPLRRLRHERRPRCADGAGARQCAGGADGTRLAGAGRLDAHAAGEAAECGRAAARAVRAGTGHACRSFRLAESSGRRG
ncbi:hypothetical protein G6F24_014847 [Rhizopus arrhizus]|nr:hypothetical protein G6F24_014847 [Rhizopus arrhizus]